MAKSNTSSRGGKSKNGTPDRQNKTAPKAVSITAKDVPIERSNVSLELQQECLDIFQDATKPHSSDTTVLQQVKTHLFARDFAAAFSHEDHLRVYASRWSPSRAMGYIQILADLETEILSATTSISEGSAPTPPRTLNVACLGGGAGAELVALAGWCKTLQSNNTTSISAQLIDSANWSTVVSALEKRITTPRELSRYASTAAREANTAMLAPALFQPRFQHIDVLAWEERAIADSLATVDLVTIMFTLNELYSSSIPNTQQLLGWLTAALRPGALLLVVDSPGSYSTVSIAGAQKTYPMVWLLDVTLLGPAAREAHTSSARKWEKLVSEDSRWFRLPQGLKYPIDLENMRYQIHLYRRVGVEEEKRVPSSPS